jgi:predicted transport protein
MSEINLYSIKGNESQELKSETVTIEKELQNLIENNMMEFFGVTFLMSEYSIDCGRIDSLGIDENYCPVIFEYKRSTNENVINQGLFYMDWLVTHQDSFYLLVMNVLGKETADKIDWTMPRLYCVANNFTKFDENAIKQMARNIALYRYRKYENDLILFELLGTNINIKKQPIEQDYSKIKAKYKDLTFAERYKKASKVIKNLYDDIRLYILSLGDDINENELSLYVAYKKTKNIICVEVRSSNVLCYLSINPSSITLESGFSRDMSNIGHWGTGDLELKISNQKDFEKAKPLFEMAYHKN